jgi:hypothetical protein
MFGLGFRLVQVQALRCHVCHRLIDSEQVDDTTVQEALFGAAKYAVCSCCGMETYDRSLGYKQRWTRWKNRTA